LVKIGEVSIKALKVFTHERRKNSVFGKLKEVDAINNKTGKKINLPIGKKKFGYFQIRGNEFKTPKS
jgi:hypothetical protein